LVDWGVAHVHGRKHGGCPRRLGELLALYAPNRVVIEHPEGEHHRWALVRRDCFKTLVNGEISERSASGCSRGAACVKAWAGLVIDGDDRALGESTGGDRGVFGKRLDKLVRCILSF
jgi:hypothetical protein